MTQLCWPAALAPSASVRLAKAAQDGPWPAPSVLAARQISASISAGDLVRAIRR